MATQKYRVWIKEKGQWVDSDEIPMTIKQAERIAKEIRKDCGVATKVLPMEMEI